MYERDPVKPANGNQLGWQVEGDYSLRILEHLHETAIIISLFSLNILETSMKHFETAIAI